MEPLARSARALVLALQYFTRIPIPAALARWAGFDAALQRASLAHFPAAGILVAAVASVCYWLADRFLPPSAFTPLVAAVLSTGATVLFTGALHEDGLADTADGLGGSADRERALDIMKDSRLGSFGVLALLLALLAKVSLLALIGAASGWAGAAAALLGGHVGSRGLTLGIVASLPNVGRAAGSKSLPLAATIGRLELAIAAAWCAAAFALALRLAPLAQIAAGLAGAVLAVLWIRRLLARRLRGFTGDGLGAAQQLCEIGFYLGFALALGRG